MRKNSKGSGKRRRNRRKKRTTRSPLPFPDVPTIYNVKQAADALNISRARLYEIFDESPGLRSFHIGSRRLITAAAINEYVAWLEGSGPSGGGGKTPAVSVQDPEVLGEASA